jgi:NADH:ubiquinone oxidoreductase subunit 6 (subunit J)
MNRILILTIIILLCGLILIIKTPELYLSLLSMLYITTLIGVVLLIKQHDLYGLFVWLVYNGAIIVLFTIAIMVIRKPVIEQYRPTYLEYLITAALVAFGYIIEDLFNSIGILYSFRDWLVDNDPDSLRGLNVSLYYELAIELALVGVILFLGVLICIILILQEKKKRKNSEWS